MVDEGKTMKHHRRDDVPLLDCIGRWRDVGEERPYGAAYRVEFRIFRRLGEPDGDIVTRGPTR